MKKLRTNLKSRWSKFLSVVAASLAALIVGVVSFVGYVNVSHAGPGYPFGGLIYKVVVCSCMIPLPPTAVYFNDLTVSSATGGLPILYDPKITQVYLFGRQTVVGSWILGNFDQSPATCIARIGKFCVNIPNAGTMLMVGSSK